MMAALRGLSVFRKAFNRNRQMIEILNVGFATPAKTSDASFRSVFSFEQRKLIPPENGPELWDLTLWLV
jgi:hypothetical protein